MGNMPTPSPLPNNAPMGGQPGAYGNMQPYPGITTGSEMNRPMPAPTMLGVGNVQNGRTEETKKKGVFESIRDFFFH